METLKQPSKQGHFTLLLTISFIALLVTVSHAYSQEVTFKKTSIKTGIGIGFNEGKRERGLGLVYSIGWQKKIGEKDRLRINPNMTFGGFLPLLISDTRDQFYRINALGFNLHYDLIKSEKVSLVTTVGGFMNYSRGLFGTGGWPEENNTRSEYFYALYFGGNASIGLRIDSKQKKRAYEIRPLNFHLGNNGFHLSYLMFGIDFKMRE